MRYVLEALGTEGDTILVVVVRLQLLRDIILQIIEQEVMVGVVPVGAVDERVVQLCSSMISVSLGRVNSAAPEANPAMDREKRSARIVKRRTRLRIAMPPWDERTCDKA